MISVPERVKDALREGNRLKNYRFSVLNDDGSVDFTIDNDTLVYESVKFDERMCSGDNLKFGLCEGSSLEFQYFDHDNINGRRLQGFIDVQYMEKSTELTQSDTTFTVPEAGSYQILVPAGSPSFYVEIRTGSSPGPEAEVSASNMDQTIPFNNLQKGTKLIIDSSSAVIVIVSRTDKPLYPMWYTIPMGYFTVSKCSRQASTGIQKVTAYNKLQSSYLDNNVNDKIIDIADEAIVGAPNETNVGMILDQLMSDYTITRPRVRPNGSFEYITPTSADSSSFVTSNGLYLHYMQVTCRFTPDDYSLDNIYRIVVNTSPIYTENKKLLPSQYLSTNFTHNGVSGTLQQWFDCEGDYEQGITSFSMLEAGVSPYYAQLITRINTNKDRYQKVSDWATNVKTYGLEFAYLGLFVVDGSQTHTWTQAEKDEAIANAQALLEPLNVKYWFVQESGQSDIEKIKITASQAENLSNVTLRQLQSASYELNCQYGQLSRTTDVFMGVELNHSALYPADSLYPADNLYPGGISETSYKSWYSKLWTDTVGAQSFRKLIITYKGLDGNNIPVDMTLERTVNANGTTDYVMSDNWLLKNLTWTAADVEAYADAMVTKMQNITWFPFEMWAAGLPYLETGDMIEIIVGDETYRSYVLQRQLSGIQNLQDTYINGTLDIF